MPIGSSSRDERPNSDGLVSALNSVDIGILVWLNLH